jgi:2,4-dienoyl-CoA reductase-like NADH-dependent reductase (Old Yellow Enzyme family)
LNNRLIFFVSVNTGFVTEGQPDERCMDFYRSRSSERLHCAIVGNVVVPDGYGSNLSTPTISHSAVWTRLASAIAARKTLPGIQLATAWEGYCGSRSFRSRDSRDTLERSKELVRGMSRAQLDRVLNSFDAGAEIALLHGFRHIQVHAAHGYLLSLLIDGRISSYADAALGRLSALARRCQGEGVETSIRISLRTGDRNFDATGREDFYAAIAALNFNFIDVSSGFYNIDKQLIYPARPEILAMRREETLNLAAAFPHRHFILSGRALTQADEHLPDNVHIGICRDLIANPKYLTELGSGCINSGKCHYFSRNEKHLTCARWPETHGEPPLRVPAA